MPLLPQSGETGRRRTATGLALRRQRPEYRGDFDNGAAMIATRAA